MFIFKEYLNKKKKFFRFVLVGFIVTLFNLFFLYIFVNYFKFDKKIIAPSISLELSIILSFFLNNSFTFGFKEFSFLRFIKFHFAAMSGFILNLIVYNFFLYVIPFHYFSFLMNFDYLIAQMMTIIIVVFWNYFINSKWTWK